MPTSESPADLDIQARAHVLANPALYEQAGRDIDATYSPEANRMLDAVNAACDTFMDWLGATADYHAIIDSNAEVKAAFYHDDSAKTRRLNPRERDLLLKARVLADAAHKAGRMIVAKVNAAAEAIDVAAVNALTRARVVTEPVQWAIDVRGKLEALKRRPARSWDDRDAARDCHASVQAVATAINPVELWMKMGAPGLTVVQPDANVNHPLRAGYHAPAPAEVVDAVCKVIADWDGVNWEAVRAVLLNDGKSRADIDAMTLEGVRQYFAVGQNRIMLHLGGRPHTASSSIISIGAPADGTMEGRPGAGIPTLQSPTDDAMTAWRLKHLRGINTQSEIASIMSAELKRTIKQGQVSRWLNEAKAYTEAGGIIQPLPTLTAQATSVDPAVIDMGPRADRRSRNQRDSADD